MAETGSGRGHAWQQATAETVFGRLRDRHLHTEGNEKRQTDNVCLTTVYRNGMRGAKCEGAQITYTQKVQDTEQVTKKDA